MFREESDQGENSESLEHEPGEVKSIDVQALCLKDLYKVYKKADREQQVSLALSYQKNGDLETRDTLFHSCTPYVIKIAFQQARFWNANFIVLDLIQEGYIGLLRSIETYDPNSGFAFSTYATWNIKQRILRFIDEQASTIRTPIHSVQGLRHLRQAKAILEFKLKRAATVPELAKELGVKEKKVKFLVELSHREVISLETPVAYGKHGESVAIGDFLFNEDDHSSFLKDIQSRDLREKLVKIIEFKRNRRSASFVISRFGLNGGQPMTLKEIGKTHGLTRERVRQIIDKVLEDKALRWRILALINGEGQEGIKLLRQIAQAGSVKVKMSGEEKGKPEKGGSMPEGTVDIERLLKELSPSDLEALAERVPQAIVEKREKVIVELSNRWVREAKELGMSPQQVLKAARKAVDIKGPRPIAVKLEGPKTDQKSALRLTEEAKSKVPWRNPCRHPHDKELTWAGTGRIPNWLITLLNNGGDPVLMA